MSTIAELNMLMNYENRQRQRRETQERQATRDNFNMFSRVAQNKVSTANELVSLSEDESNLDTLDSLVTQIEGTKTGVDYVDSLIDAKIQNVELRKRTVNAKNKIDERIVELNDQLGEGTTVGAKELLNVLKKDYSNTVDQLAQDEKVLLDERIENAENNFEFRLLKNQYDTDLETEGFQLPSYMNRADREYFREVVEPMVNVADESGNYIDAIRALQRGFGDIRRERADYDSALGRARARDIKDEETTIKKNQELMRLKKFGELETTVKSYQNAFAHLKDPKKRGQQDFYNTLTSIENHVLSKTGENLQTADLQGMLKTVDTAIMKQLEDKRGFFGSNVKPGEYETFGDSNYLDGYIEKGNPLDKKHMTGMEVFIERNKNVDKDGGITYNKLYGDGPESERGVTLLINTRKQLIEMLNTPDLLLQNNEDNQNVNAVNKSSFGQKIKPPKG
jgi:hypothetical protein